MEIELREASRQFMRRGEKFFAIENIDLQIKQGEFLFLTGSSGSGKTTLLHIICGLLYPTSGKVFLDGNQWENMTDKQASVFRNRQIGFIPQEESLLSNLTVFENICLPYSFSKETKVDSEKIARIAERLEIRQFFNAYPKELSGGEKRRVMIARAVILSPKIILADEPTANLDEENAKEVMEILKEINRKGATVLVSTHEKEIIFGNNGYEMKHGRLVTVQNRSKRLLLGP